MPRGVSFRHPALFFRPCDACGELLLSACMPEPWLEGCLPTQVMKAAFSGSGVPFGGLQGVGGQAGARGGWRRAELQRSQ